MSEQVAPQPVASRPRNGSSSWPQFVKVCPWCNRVQREEGQWVEAEIALFGNGVRLDHGICPDCAVRMVDACGAGDGRG